MKSILMVLLVVLVVVAGIWYFKKSGSESTMDGQQQQQGDKSKPSNSNTNGSSNTSNGSTNDSGSGVEEVPNSLKGELQKSNDPNRGTLMLLLSDSDRIIYLYTSRDYSALLGKNVMVTIDGSLDDFRLVDIKEQGN